MEDFKHPLDPDRSGVLKFNTSAGWNCRHHLAPANRSAAELQRYMDEALAKEDYEAAAKILPILEQAERVELIGELEALCDNVGVGLPKVSIED